MAARAAARRCAALLGEPLGRRVGYTVRLESRTSRDTRIEFVTTGVLLRRLMRQVTAFACRLWSVSDSRL
jgi:ATP-dependent helicase HrpB